MFFESCAEVVLEFRGAVVFVAHNEEISQCVSIRNRGFVTVIVQKLEEVQHCLRIVVGQFEWSCGIVGASALFELCKSALVLRAVQQHWLVLDSPKGQACLRIREKQCAKARCLLSQGFDLRPSRLR